MEIPSKILEHIVFKTTPKIEEHTLIVLDKPSHEMHLAHPIQTKSKQIGIALTLITGYNSIFNV